MVRSPDNDCQVKKHCQRPGLMRHDNSRFFAKKNEMRKKNEVTRERRRDKGFEALVAQAVASRSAIHAIL
jgi:hypothetical protein